MLFSIKNLLAALAFIVAKLEQHAAKQRDRADELRETAASAMYEAKVADKDATAAEALAANIGKLTR